jgi:hypothetical protein
MLIYLGLVGSGLEGVGGELERLEVVEGLEVGMRVRRGLGARQGSVSMENILIGQRENMGQRDLRETLEGIYLNIYECV